MQLRESAWTNFCKKAGAHEQNLDNIRTEAQMRVVNGSEKENQKYVV